MGLVFCLADFLSAQTLSPEVLSSNGGSSLSSSVQMDWTIGEIAIETLHSSNGIYTEGFHQPILTVQKDNYSLQEEASGQGKRFDDIIVTPNPVSTSLNVHFTAGYEVHLSFQLLSSEGTLAKQGEGYPIDGDMQIELTGLPAGLYILRLHDEVGTIFPVFRISKIQ